MKQRAVFSCFLFSLLVYLGCVFTFPSFAYTVPLFVGVAGALAAAGHSGSEKLSSRGAAVTVTVAWLVGSWIGPPQRVLFDSFYYEAPYVELLNQLHSAGPWIPLRSALLVAVSAFGCGQIRWSRGGLRWVALSLLFLASMSQLVMVWILGKTLPRTYHREPPAKSYTFDGVLFNKILHAYKDGKNYYEACDSGMKSDSRTYEPGYPWNSFRPAFPFWLLTLLPDLGFVPLVYWGLTVLVQFAVYLASRRLLDPIPAILAPILLGAYLLYQNTTNFLLMPDVGGGQLIVLSVAIYLIAGWPLAFVILAFSGLVREFGVGYLIFAGLLALRAGRKKEAAGAALMVAVDGLTYLWHNYNCRTILGMVASAPLDRRLSGSPTFALSALRHGWVFILQGQISSPCWRRWPL